METKEILKGNKLIADFIGVKTTISDDLYWIDFCDRNVFVEDMKYHSSWDWLKPVIDKIIETIGAKSEYECTEEERRQYTTIIGMYIGVPIEWAYNYVLEFILWYNKNNRNG